MMGESGMVHLLFPGRHLVNTRFQEDYLKQVLGVPLGDLRFLHRAQDLPKDGTLKQIAWPVTNMVLVGEKR